MPTELTIDRHIAGLGTAMTAFVRYADRAGLEADVPTCPGWSVRDLIAHEGMVHRWAAGLLGAEPAPRPEPDAWEREGRSAPDPLGWLRVGAVELTRRLAQAPDDVRAPVFLNDAPGPRAFWARRQCHETTIHAVDAQSAALGRAPKAEEVGWVDHDVAVDGIDELLGGFLTRRRERLRTDEESILVVAPDETPWWWEVSLGPRPALTYRRTGPVGEGDWVLTGTATELYLRLWNRGVPAESPAGGVELPPMDVELPLVPVDSPPRRNSTGIGGNSTEPSRASGDFPMLRLWEPTMWRRSTRTSPWPPMSPCSCPLRDGRSRPATG